MHAIIALPYLYLRGFPRLFNAIFSVTNTTPSSCQIRERLLWYFAILYINLRLRTKKTKIAPVLFIILKCFKVSKFGGILTKSFTALKLLTRPRVLNFVVKLFIVFLYLMADSRQADSVEARTSVFYSNKPVQCKWQKDKK